MVAIRSIETAVPSTVVVQSDLRDLLSAQPEYGRLGARLVTAAFNASAIETRHTVIEEFGRGPMPTDPSFLSPETGRILSPGTRARNDIYIAHSTRLVLEAAEKALEAVQDLAASDVTHVITVSCTGFSAPGPDYVLVRELGLSPSTQRYHLGFMGCYGAFPALHAATQFCEADPLAVVLIVCVELCSLHVHVDNDPDTIVAASVFADGAAAAVVTARPAPQGATVLELDAAETVLVPEGEGDMAWTIGDHGFDMVLSSYVPRIVEKHIREALEPLLAHDPVLARRPPAAIDRWAIHPGGRSILDRVETELGLSADQLEPSRQILRDFGNMSSATVLFILGRLLREGPRSLEPALALAGASVHGARLGDEAGADDLTGETSRRAATQEEASERVCAMAFGPGLTVETALMTLKRQA